MAVSDGGPPASTRLLAVPFLLVAGAVLLRGGRRSRPVPALVLWSLVGLLLGYADGRRVRASCLASLSSGDRIVARGRLALPVPGRPASTGSPRRRLRLEDVVLRRGERTCSVPEIRARGAPPAAGGSAGSRLSLEGRWWRPGPTDPAGAAPLSSFGLLMADEVALVDRGDVDDGGRLGPLAELRARASRRLSERLPADVAPVARALLVADRGDLEPALARRFAEAGLAHMLAVSGLHVGILGAGFLGLLGLVWRRPGRRLVAAGGVGIYVLVLGAPPATLRAALLFAAWAVARGRGAPARASELVAGTAVAALLARPAVVLEVGFQLSYAGFTGLLIGSGLARRWVRWLEAPPVSGRRDPRASRSGRRVGRRARAAAAVAGASAGAFLLTLPFAAAYFHRAAPVSVAASPASTPLLGLGLVASAATLVLPGFLAAWAAGAAATLLRLLVRWVDLLASLPGGHGDVLPPGAIEWLVFALAVGAAAWLAAGGRAGPALVAGALALAGWSARPAIGALRGPDATLVCALAVGQGDAAVVRTPKGGWVVVDAGPAFGARDAGREVVAPFLRDRGARTVDLFVLSHPDRDHVGGAATLFERFRVDRVLDAGNPLPRPAYAEFLAGVAEEGARWIPARAGQRYGVDGIDVTVLDAGPKPEVGRDGGETNHGGQDAGGQRIRGRWAGPPVEANEASVSIRLSVGGGFAYVNPGDASVEGERRMLARWPADSLRAIMLKAGHHGSRSSTGAAWLAAVRPRLVVVSAGPGNRYGHPHGATLRRLREAEVERVWRTDRDGTLCVEARRDGRWRIEGERSWRRSVPP